MPFPNVSANRRPTAGRTVWGTLAGLRRASLTVVRQMNRFNKEVPVKTKASVGRISLPDDVLADLNEWRKWCGTAEKENDYTFTSRRGSPIHFKKWIDRTLTPAATKAGMLRISYHMFRRGLATEMHQNGSVDKNIQNHVSHLAVFGSLPPQNRLRPGSPKSIPPRIDACGRGGRAFAAQRV